MLPNRLQRSAMTSREKFVARASIVDHHPKSAFDSGCCADLRLRLERSFDTFSLLRMNRISIEEFQFFGRSWNPGLDTVTAACVDAQRTLWTEDFHWKCIEKLVGENNAWLQDAIFDRLKRCLARLEVTT